MLLKRKRSTSELCSSPSSHCSYSSSSPHVSPRASHDAPASHLPGRTLKRFRNSRPSDEEVHQRTLSLLYSAQQQQQHQHTPLPLEATVPALSSAGGGNQHSLHRFWNINSAPRTVASSPGTDRLATSTCEDCGTGLGAADDEMDLDGAGCDSEKTACGACGKHVCFSCSVSNLGEEKRCLQCAGRKVWIGGIGWTNSGVSVR